MTLDRYLSLLWHNLSYVLSFVPVAALTAVAVAMMISIPALLASMAHAKYGSIAGNATFIATMGVLFLLVSPFFIA